MLRSEHPPLALALCISLTPSPRAPPPPARTRAVSRAAAAGVELLDHGVEDVAVELSFFVRRHQLYY